MARPERFNKVQDLILQGLEQAGKESRIRLILKSRYSNPGYLQLKIQYFGPLCRNWLKVDVTPEPPIGNVLLKRLSGVYSDYQNFKVRVESLEEIFAQKLRALVERKKVRDYFDVWKLNELEVGKNEVTRLFQQKLQVKNLTWHGLPGIFPSDLETILAGYWERELGRLVWPVPDMNAVLKQLKAGLNWLERLSP